MRASRANARAATTGPAKASRTVRIRPDELDDVDSGYDDADDVADYDDEPAPAKAAPRRVAKVTATAPPAGSRPPAKATPRVAAEPEPEAVEPRPAQDAARPAAPVGVPVAPPPVKAPAPVLASLEPEKPGRTSEEIVRDVVDKFGTVFNYVAVVAALILIVYVLLKAGGANDTNSIYTWFRDRSNNDIVFAFRHLFKENPVDGKNDVAANFLTAAAVYLVVGAIVKRICRRIAGR